MAPLLRFVSLLGLTSLLTLVSASAPIIAQYYPAYSEQTVAEIPFSEGNLALYFVTVTTVTGFEVPSDQKLSEIPRFVKAAHAAGNKALFVVGGWTGSVYFSDLVASSTKRTRFAKQLAAFQDKYGFDGVDLDWEYPNGEGIGCNTVRANDAAHFLSFLKVLRSTIGKKKLITAAVSSAGFIGIDGEPITSGLGAYAKYLNYINLMTYDFAGSWSETTAANSPLRTCLGDGSVEDSVALWVKGGFPAKQILLGIPSYAISFTTTKQPLKGHKIIADGKLYHSKLYQAWTGVTPKGSHSDSNTSTTDVCGSTTSAYTGQWQYVDLIKEGALSADGKTGQKGFVRHWDDCTQTPFLYHYHRRQLISYDDAQSAGVKAEYAREKGLGGVMIFDSTGFNSAVSKSIKRHLA